jgi:hypothetical protein
MFYKKQILERYKKSNVLTKDEPPKSNNFDNCNNCNQIIYKNKILKIYNSPLINKNPILMKPKLVKPKLQLVETSIMDTMHWEILEEITYSDFLYNKYKKKSKKHKVDNTYVEDYKDIKDIKHKLKKLKKSKKLNENLIVRTQVFAIDNDVIIKYDSDETETEDENDTFSL